MSGWTAHVLEQYHNNRLIRPRAEYKGKPDGQAVDSDGAAIAAINDGRARVLHGIAGHQAGAVELSRTAAPQDTYELRWVVRKKKDRLPPGADERDRAKFAKAQSYMVLLDDKASCKNLRCRSAFDISGVKTMAFI